MTNPEDIRMAVRRDVLVDRIQRIIERQTAIVPLSFQQVTDLQEAIAHFTADHEFKRETREQELARTGGSR